MKSVVVFLLLFTGLFAQAEKNIKLSEELYVLEIKQDAYQIFHYYPYPNNSLVIKVSENDFVMCDTPVHKEATELVHKWLLKKYGEVNLNVINTHYHNDCLGGNEYLVENNIPVYGSDLTIKMLEEKTELMRNLILSFLTSDTLKSNYIKNQKFVAPTNVFNINEGLKLKFGDQSVEVFFPGAGHTPDNVVVYFPERKILFGGCLFKSLGSNSKGNIKEADLTAWPNSCKKVAEKFSDAEIVLPGHGKYGDKSIISHTIDVVSAE